MKNPELDGMLLPGARRKDAVEYLKREAIEHLMKAHQALTRRAMFQQSQPVIADMKPTPQIQVLQGLINDLTGSKGVRF